MTALPFLRQDAFMHEPLIQETLSFTPQMMVVLIIIAITLILFITEWVRIDVAAILVMITLGLLSLIPSLEGLADPVHLFDGFSSNAVIAIMAVMIMGEGLDKTGMMNKLAALALRTCGDAERRLVPVLSLVAGAISGFLQNAGAAALFLPILSRVSARTNIPLSRILMPVGFCILLGGTITLIGSSPLVIINDLLPSSLEPFELFDVVPVGLALLISGIVYFYVWGSRMMPDIQSEGPTGGSTMKYFERVYGISFVFREVRLLDDSPWVGRTIGEIEKEAGVVVAATFMRGDIRVGPWSGLIIEKNARLAILGQNVQFDRWADQYKLDVRETLDVFNEALSPVESGIAEVVVHPNSNLIGKTVTEIAMRKTYGLSVLAIHRGDKSIRKDLRDVPLMAGDTLVCHCAWDALARVEHDRNFVVVTSAYPYKELRPQKVVYALFFFLFSISLVFLGEVRLSLAFFAGAAGMIVTGVLTIEEAYRSVGWRTVFLLASLLPLGMAVQNTGTAMWIAQQTLALLGSSSSPLLLQLILAVLTTGFTLVTTNVGSTVLLVPFAIHMALAAQATGIDADPRVFAMTVGIVATNGFLLPTNQVMSIYAGPGGYRAMDFLRVGLPMSVLFILVSLVTLNLVF